MQTNLVLFLLSLLSIEVESPENGGCAGFEDDFGYCEKKRNQCLLETPETVDCEERMNECFKEINVGDSNCNITYESNSRNRTHDNMQATQKPPMETLNSRLKILQNTMNDVKRNCFKENDFENQIELLQDETNQLSEFSRSKIPTAIVLSALIHDQNTSEECKQSLEKFEKSIAILDSEAFSIMLIPFDHWHCGWAYGDVGRVILRLFASIATPNFAMHFNHACAIQRDCYMSRKQRMICDRMFKNSIQGIVNSLKRNKKGAEEFNEILMELSDWKTEYAYSIANLTESSYKTYSGSEGPFNEFNYHKPMNKTAVVFMELNVAKNIKKELDKLYPHCKFHKNEISSCFNNYMNSYEDLSECLSDIEDVKCTHQIKEAKRALETNEKNKKTWFEWIIYILGIISDICMIIVPIVAAVRYCLRKYRDKYRRVPTSEPTSVAESCV